MSKEKYSHRERLEIILAGEKPDRYAASFWRHFFHMENNAEGTAEAMIGFQKQFEWDFIKINPRADYHVEDWGLTQQWSRSEFKKHIKSNFPIRTIDDWDKITVNPLSSPVLDEHLDVVNRVRKGVGPDVPILMTVFTPLAIAGRLFEDQQELVRQLRSNPAIVHQGLRTITDTFVPFVEELRNAGADGIFLATTQWASSDMISFEEYKEFGLPYDKEIVAATAEDPINLFHICSENNYLKELATQDMRCSMYNWDSQHPTNNPIDTAYAIVNPHTIVGGVDQKGWLLKSEPDEVIYQLKQLKEKSEPSQLIIGPGCSVPPEVPMINFQAIRENL